MAWQRRGGSPSDGMTVALTDLDEAAARQAAASTWPERVIVGWPWTSRRRRRLLPPSTRSNARSVQSSVLAHFAGTFGAGGSAPGHRLAQGHTLDDWEFVQAINARGTFLCVREMARRRTAVPVEHGPFCFDGMRRQIVYSKNRHGLGSSCFKAAMRMVDLTAKKGISA